MEALINPNIMHYGNIPLPTTWQLTMSEKKTRSAGLRALNSICATVAIVSVVYMLIAGFNIFALALIASSVVGVAAPVAMAAEGVLEAVAGVFEAIADGIAAIFEAIASFLGDLF